MIRPATANLSRFRKPKQLQALTPLEFEHLIFDLMVSRGMANVAWRTPGADGGRDIEGTVTEKDLSDIQLSRKWFVECKKYASSVDWPTIYAKLSYADSNQVDVLLMCTTSTFSPTAISQVENWNSTKRSVAIRLWPRHEIELQLQQHPDLLLKYGLSDIPSTPGRSIVELALALSKTVSSHYSRLVFQNAAPDAMLLAAQAFAELISKRMEDIEREGVIRPSFPDSVANALDFCTTKGTQLTVDEFGIRAFVAYLAALSPESVSVSCMTDICKISSKSDLAQIVDRYRPVFVAISIWSDFEFSASRSTVHIKQRQ